MNFQMRDKICKVTCVTYFFQKVLMIVGFINGSGPAVGFTCNLSAIYCCSPQSGARPPCYTPDLHKLQKRRQEYIS